MQEEVWFIPMPDHTEVGIQRPLAEDRHHRQALGSVPAHERMD